MITHGFSAKEANKYKTFPCDKVTLVGEEFGDESKEFIDYIDEIHKVGGRRQSENEYNMFLDKYGVAKAYEYAVQLDRR